MATRDPRIDAYIAKSAEFARPILAHLREVVHAACPDVEETMKWSRPHFLYKGLLCGMSAFKEHCAFGFWNSSLIVGKAKAAARTRRRWVSSGGSRRLSDLPSKKVLTGYIKEAMKLNEAGVKAPSRIEAQDAQGGSVVPDDLADALAKNPAAHVDLREVQPQPEARVRRVDHRGQDRGDAHPTAGDGDRVDVRG